MVSRFRKGHAQGALDYGRRNILFSFAMILVCSAVMGVPLYRDNEYNTRNYLYTIPITKGIFQGNLMGGLIFLVLYIWGLGTLTIVSATSLSQYSSWIIRL